MKQHPHGNRVRIIGGEWRSRLIAFPQLEALRPTPDRVRETLFNWLGQTLHGKRCLDLFAGSGALGFEALSRGAEQVVMVESSRSALDALRDNAAKLGATALHISGADALQFVAACKERFDVVFIDPPYGSPLLAEFFPLLVDRLRPAGTVYFESASAVEMPPGWKIIKQGRAGMVHFQLAALSEEPSS